MRILAGATGLSAIAIFLTAIAYVSNQTPDFSHFRNAVSELGTQESPHAQLWNLVGFNLVGGLLALFGLMSGSALRDMRSGIPLVLFGVAFAATGVPMDFADESARSSVIHVAMIVSALAFWALAMTSLMLTPRHGTAIQNAASIALAIVFVGLALRAIEVLPMPVTQRIMFVSVFGWVVVMSLILITKKINPAP